MSSKWLERPPWLAALANAVMDDIQGDQPLSGVQLVVVEGDDPDTFGIGVYEQDGTGSGAGSREMISSTTTRTEALPPAPSARLPHPRTSGRLARLPLRSGDGAKRKPGRLPWPRESTLATGQNTASGTPALAKPTALILTLAWRRHQS